MLEINGLASEPEIYDNIVVITDRDDEDTGARETFLLHAIAERDTYDADIIEKCNAFVDNIDSEERYLTKRRYVTKAKFDVYFSIRTSADQFTERQNILKGIDWNEYVYIQDSFQKLGEL